MAHKTPEFEKIIRKAMTEWKVPGLAIAVIQGDEIYTKGYGLARIPDESATADTLFDCASTAKSFTAAAVALFVHDCDKFPDTKWTTPVSRLLRDDFVLADPQYTENVTIEDILSHRSGMPGHDESYLGINSATPDTPKSVTRNLRNLPLSRPLRSEFQYCNMMYTVASYMVEVLSGEQFAEFLQNRIWDPLQMSNTYHDISGIQARNATALLAHGYRWDEKAEYYVKIPLIEQPEAQGAGIVFSSVNDYAKWIRALIKRTGPLPLAAHKELVKPRAIMHEEEEDRIPLYSQALYALGWVVETYRGLTVIGHSGSVPGFNSLMRYLPELEWGIVIFGNSNGAGDIAEILCWHLVDELLSVPTPERLDWTALQREHHEKSKQEEKDRLQSKPLEPESAMSVPLLQYAGKYRNPGYHDLILEVKDGKFWADCSDRTFGFVLSFDHVSGDTFVAEIRDILDDSKRNVGAEFQLGALGEVESLGVEFVKEMKAEMIWFTKVE